VAPRAACHGMRVKFCIFGKNDTQPQGLPDCCCSDASSQPGVCNRHCAMARHSRRLGGGRLWLLGRRATICVSIFVSLEKMTLILNAPCLLLLRRQHPAGVCNRHFAIVRRCRRLGGGLFVAPRASVSMSRQVCTLPANFGDLVQLVTQPQRSLFAAP